MQQQDNHEYPFLYQRQTCHQVQPNQATYQKRQKCQPATYLQEVLYQLYQYHEKYQPHQKQQLIRNGRSLNELNRGQSGLETYGLFSNLTHDFLPISGLTASDSDSNPRSFKMSTRESLP